MSNEMSRTKQRQEAHENDLYRFVSKRRTKKHIRNEQKMKNNHGPKNEEKKPLNLSTLTSTSYARSSRCLPRCLYLTCLIGIITNVSRNAKLILYGARS